MLKSIAHQLICFTNVVATEHSLPARRKLNLMHSVRKLLVFVAMASAVAMGRTAARVNSAEILWDHWGVPHIFSSDDETAFQAFGWAQMHNHGEQLLHLYALARGRGAEYFGPDDLRSDRMIRTLGIPLLARQWYLQQPRSFRADLDAFAFGINSYAESHGQQLDSAARNVLPVSGSDIMAHVIRVLWLFQGNVSGCAEAMNASNMGSNGWAVAASHSSTGHALLLANPHLPWTRDFLFFEAQISTPAYQAYGASLIGFPVLAIAFNQALGWTHTVNTIDTCDLYMLTPDGSGYRFDGHHRDFDLHTETIKVRQADGSVSSESLSIRIAAQGPVIQRSGKLLSVRDAGLQSGSFAGVLQQWWEMGHAHKFAEFQSALRRMQLPMFNTIYADKDGNAFLIYAGLVPKRTGGDFKFWSAPVPGDTSATLWTGFLDYNSLPKVLNPGAGWVQNSNSAPWYMTEPALDPAQFPGFLAPSMADPAGWPSFREQRGLRMLTEVEKLSYDQLVADKYSTHSELADRFIDDLIAAAKAHGSDRAKRAASVLAAWDRNTDADSKGAVLFFAWARRTFRGGLPTAEPFDAARLLQTPRGLKDPTSAAQQLDAAAAEIESNFGSLDVPWGIVFRLRHGSFDLPGNGAPGGLGVFRVIEYAPDKDGRFGSIGGDSFMFVVEFSTPLKAGVLLTYGNASDPRSPHCGDQLELAAKKQLRPALMTRAEVEAQLEERSTIEGRH